MKNIIPKNTRYVPIPQQRYCCVPACISMIMLRNNIPLIPQELLGYHLGLRVPPEEKDIFYNARVNKENTPSSTSYGTQIQNKKYDINKALTNLNIPLKMSIVKSSTFKDLEDFKKMVQTLIKKDKDMIICFNWGVLVQNPEKDLGHACLIDFVDNDKFMLLDPGSRSRMWLETNVDNLYNAIVHHGGDNFGGIWVFDKLSS